VEETRGGEVGSGSPRSSRGMSASDSRPATNHSGSGAGSRTLQCEGGIAGEDAEDAGLEATVTGVLIRIHHADGRVGAISFVLRARR
jgi:hypothetical protein